VDFALEMKLKTGDLPALETKKMLDAGREKVYNVFSKLLIY